MLPGALGLVLVGYAEHLGAIQQGALTRHDDVDPKQELRALGVCNASIVRV